MKLHFYKLSDYRSFKRAEEAGAVRTLHVEDTEHTNILDGGPVRDLFDAIIAAVDMMDGNETICFVLTTDHKEVLDIHVH